MWAIKDFLFEGVKKGLECLTRVRIQYPDLGQNLGPDINLAQNSGIEYGFQKS